MLTTSGWLNIVSASSGMIGSVLLYIGSFGFEAPAVYMNQKMIHEMSARNQKRKTQQRAGMIALFIGFLLQLLAQFA